MLQRSKIKYIQNLGHKKFRDEESLFIAEGPRLIQELMISKRQFIKEIFAIKEWIDENKEKLSSIEVLEITEAELERISQLKTPNKVLAVVNVFKENLPEKTNGKIILALNSIQDPGNLGTIIRISDWFGITDIVCDQATADCFNPKVVQATMGSIARVNVHYTDLNNWLEHQKDSIIYACVMDGIDISGMKKIKEGILIIGNEANGIDPANESLAKERISIRGRGGAESLNAAVATGIILFQLT